MQARLYALTGLKLDRLSTKTKNSYFDAVQGHVSFEVGEHVFIELHDKYGRIEQIYQMKEDIIVKIRYYRNYIVDTNLGLDFSAIDDVDDYGLFYAKDIDTSIAVARNISKGLIYFIGSLKFDLEYEWLSEHINIY